MSQQKTILLVEDDSIMALSGKRVLEKYDYAVLVANTGESAITLFTDNPEVALVLMDIDLGDGIDGTETADLLLHIRQVPIVFLSSHTEPEIVEKTEKITSYGYVVKNSSNTVLEASIKMAFKLFEANQLTLANEKHIARQLRYANALNQIAEIIISEDHPEEILHQVNEIIATALESDRALIYDIFFAENRIEALCELLTKNHPEVLSTKGKYTSLEMFGAAFKHIRETRQHLESFADKVNPLFAGCEATEILHTRLHIKSLVWYPFAFDDHGYYLFTIYSILEKRVWTPEDLFFLESVAKQVSLALMKISLHREQLDVERALRTSNNYYRILTDNMKDVVWVIDTESLHYTYLSPSVSRLRGYTADEIMSAPVGKHLLAESADNYLTMVRECAEAFKQGAIAENDFRTIEMQLPCKNGSKVWTEIVASPRFNRESGHIEICGVTRDISRRKEVDEALRKSEAQLRSYFDLPIIGIAITNLAKEWLDVNDCLLNLLGYSWEELVGLTWADLTYPDDLEEDNVEFEKLLRGEIENYTIDKRYVHKDGHPIWVNIGVGCVRKENELAIDYVVAIVTDIHERKKAETEVKQLLQDKELLLTEVHHRIKNNMSTIYWLLNLQADTMQDAAAIKALQDASSRIMSMMTLYNMLYKSNDTESLLASDYIGNLSQQILDNFPQSPQITMTVECGVFQLKAKQLQPLGILLNEIITNSVKHAFSGIDHPRIEISCQKNDDFISLTLADNGIGLPQSIDLGSPTSFGIQLITMLVLQLDGQLDLNTEQGTRYSISFSS